MTTYPSAVDYTLALQNPGSAFADSSLRGASFTQGLLGPYGIAGSSAVVFHAVVSGDDWALRCYTREDASTPERYAALGGFVAEHKLTAHVGGVTWFQEEVQVRGARWPVLKMAWIEGQQLNEYVGFLADDGNSGALRTLAARWVDLINSLQQVRFAHGDLQHGNILVDQQGQLRLVDFDSVWIPQLQGQEAPTESGHASYQPFGTANSGWGPYMDTFPGLVIYLALTALAKNPGLWSKFNNGDNLLFERDDFSPPFDTDVWQRLAGLADPDIDRIAGKLKECCAPGWTPTQSLQDALGLSKSPPDPPGHKWWEQLETPAPTAPTASPSAAKSSTTPAPSQPTSTAAALPPPPKAPVQSAIAPQSGKSPSSGSWQFAKTGAADGDGRWWEPQQGKAKAGVAGQQSKGAAAKNKKPGRDLVVAWSLFLFILLVVGALIIVAALH